MKPVIIVFSQDDDTTFRFLSDGWNTLASPNQQLLRKAKKAIASGTDVRDTIARLEQAGFAVRRQGE